MDVTKLLDGQTSNFSPIGIEVDTVFVTRQVFSGAGKIKSEKMVIILSHKRAQHIREEISIATTTARGIINTRDEPHADREKYRRLHVIVGDSNMSEFTNFLKIATTNIILRMIEDGFIEQNFNLRNAVRAIQQISDDITCTRKIRTSKMESVYLRLNYNGNIFIQLSAI